MRYWPRPLLGAVAVATGCQAITGLSDIDMAAPNPPSESSGGAAGDASVEASGGTGAAAGMAGGAGSAGDASVETGGSADAGPDTDVGDGGHDAHVGLDADVETGDGGPKADVDGGSDAGPEVDGGEPDSGLEVDAGSDSGPQVDAGSDAGPEVKCVLQASAGWAHACAVKGDGTLWCWGRNEWGQVGQGSTCSPFPCGEPFPLRVTALGTNVVEVAAAGVHACARKSDGTLWCWPYNATGQLGDGTTTNKLVPVQVAALGTTVVEVTAGYGHTCARKSDGTVWCWGSNAFGELGDGTISGTAPTCQYPYICKPSPVQVAALGTSVVEIAASTDNTCARKSDGKVWCWGSNANGELGNGTTSGQSCHNGTPCQPSPAEVTVLGTSAVELAAGYNHICARKNDGTLWCWGNNANGQLGDGTTTGQTCFSGYPCKPSPQEATGLGTNVVEVAAGGSYHSAYLGHTCARKSDDTLWCWGSNVYGQLGNGATGGQSCYNGYACEPSPGQVTALGSSAVSVAAGVDSSCAVKDDGTLWCWGGNVFGQLGNGTTNGQSCYKGEPCKPFPGQVALGCTLGTGVGLDQGGKQ
jgi:alpha-tubulin suppressor-like RCC1 family protein